MARLCSLALILVLASSSAALAQNSGIGVRIGANFMSPSVSPDDGRFPLEGRTGIVGGVFFVAPVAPQISIQPEVLYSQKRGKLVNEAEDFEAKFDIDYFDVPVLVRWDSTSSGQSTFNVFGGPSFNFRYRAHRKDDLLGDVEIEDLIEEFELSLVFGAGVEIGQFVLDGRYNHGLTNIIKEPENEGFELKNRSFSVSAGFRF